MLVKICNKYYDIQKIKSLSVKNPHCIIVELKNGAEHCLSLPNYMKISAQEYLQELENSLRMITFTFGNRGEF